MNNLETTKQRINRAEKIAWIIFIGLGLNYFLLTMILAQ